MDMNDFVIDEIVEYKMVDENGNEIKPIIPDKYSESLKGNDFKYSWKTINKLIDEYGLSKAVMHGVYDDCEKLKPIIEKLYEEKIFYLSYWESECGFHGWNWSEDDGSMKNMAEITDGITNRFHEIYALILSGLGLRFDKDENNEVVLKRGE